jgi:tetratricopeptide (TPR) repeat protein
MPRKQFVALQKEQPDNPAVHLRSAAYYQLRGMKAEAEKSYLRGLQLEPSSDDALQQVAQFYVSQRATDRAIELINTTVPDAKKKPFHYELVGNVYGRAGRSQDAEAAFKKALQLDPTRIEAKASLASEYINQKRFDDALKQLDDLLKQTPNNAGAFTIRGMVLQTKGDSSGAKDSYEKALSVDPNSYVAANNLAYMLGQEGKDLEVALSHAQNARRLQPNEPASADTLGWIQHLLGRDVLARDQLQFAVSKQPDNATFQYHLGMIYKETKQTAQAQAALQKAVSSKESFKEKSLAEAALKELRQAR